MESDFGLKVRVHKPRVSYRETIESRVKAEGVFDRQTAGVTQFFQVTLQVEPFQGDEPIVVESRLKPGDLPQEFAQMLVEAVAESVKGGGLVGYPLMNVKFTVLDVKYRDGDTTDVAIQAAAGQAVQNALSKAGVVLLEPIMSLEVVVPDDYLGNIQADLNVRRAMIVNSDRRGGLAVLQAEAALSQMFGYSTQVRSLSQGRASYSMHPLKYAPAPPDVLRDMLG
jgi:elongation factor G